jgi:isoleucyl-tRNA synthetase
MSSLDMWMLSRLQKLIERVTEAYGKYAFHVIYHSIHNFCSIDLSALYLDIVKDRIYVEGKNTLKRRASQTVIYEVLTALVKLIAPILSFTAEEMWFYLRHVEERESILLSSFPLPRKELINEVIEDEWERIWKIREFTNKKIEEKRVEKIIGHSLDTKIKIQAPENDCNVLRKLGNELKDVFIVSQVEVHVGDSVDVIVSRADGKKCERCWQYFTDVSTNDKFPNVCRRCEDTLSSL